MNFVTGIKWLPGTDVCRVEVEDRKREDDDTLDRQDLGFKDSTDGGLWFRFVFAHKDKDIYVSLTYYKPDGVTLTEFALQTLDANFPEGHWPRDAKSTRVKAI